jgi:hypothetical protein
MKGCEVQESGTIEVYFYGELDAAERASVERHVSACAECRCAFEELSLIREALATRPRIDAPPNSDWRPFMNRLDNAIRFEAQTREAARVVAMPVVRERTRLAYAPYLALAAVLTLVTSSVVYFGRSGARPDTTVRNPENTTAAVSAPQPVVATPAAGARSPEAAFAALSEEHFERSKLVVLGLANKDPKRVNDDDWAYERALASNLLNDTRLYRMTAEERGLKILAGVMRDLEMVLLQTSMAEQQDPDALEQIQRFIHKRDLVTKMDVAATTGS